MKVAQENNQNILIISTEVNSSRILADILRQQEYQVSYIKDVATALTEINRNIPDLIFLEFKISDFNSQIICQQLKANFLPHKIPIICLSAVDDVLDRAKIYQAGGADYILEPYQEEEVLRKVDNQLTIQLAEAEQDFLDRILEVKIQERTLQLQTYIKQLQKENEKLQQVEQQLSFRALHDGLTGLPNRTLLMEKIDNALQRSKRKPSYSFALLFIDLDHFKIINDSLGHEIGDKLLIEVAQLLLKDIRDIDTAARIGGDEFVILLDDVQNSRDVTYICDRLLDKFKVPITIEDWTISTSLSIGIAFSYCDYQNGSQMLHDADMAMYRAKARKKGSYEVFQRNRANAL